MLDKELSFPGIVYLQPEVCEILSFDLWFRMKHHAIIVAPVPRNVFNWLTTSNLGVFTKIQTKMYPQLLRR